MSLLEATARLVAVSSISRDEAAMAALVENELRPYGHLEVERVGDNVVARTTWGRSRRVIIAGHLDTVPGDPAAARLEGDTLFGLGACDMKGSLAVMLALAARDERLSVDLTWIFYAREEIARSESGLVELAQLRPDLVVADAAILAEPTGGAVEAGCQGTLRAAITLRGARAHTARPFTGRNAIHRLGAVLERVAHYEPRVAVVDGVAYTEQLQVVFVEGGVANNVVPDVASCVLNHRVAPDRTCEEAAKALLAYLDGLLEPGDEFVVTDSAPPAPPALHHEVIERLVAATGAPARAKVGWTDVATFAEAGIAATNFGAGDPLLAHRSDEFVTASELEHFSTTLWSTLHAL